MPKLYVARVDAVQISKLSDADLRQYVERIAGPIEITEEDGQVAAWVHFKTDKASPDGRRKLSWHQKTGLGSSWREAMEFLAESVADDAD
jgi:hypothetical protein